MRRRGSHITLYKVGTNLFACMAQQLMNATHHKPWHQPLCLHSRKTDERATQALAPTSAPGPEPGHRPWAPPAAPPRAEGAGRPPGAPRVCVWVGGGGGVGLPYCDLHRPFVVIFGPKQPSRGSIVNHPGACEARDLGCYFNPQTPPPEDHAPHTSTHIFPKIRPRRPASRTTTPERVLFGPPKSNFWAVPRSGRGKIRL